jgi:hypothetical protein
MDIYEVELCHRGRWGQQDARFVAARDANEAAYNVTGSICAARANAGKFGYASAGLGTEAHRQSCFTPGDGPSRPLCWSCGSTLTLRPRNLGWRV